MPLCKVQYIGGLPVVKMKFEASMSRGRVQDSGSGVHGLKSCQW